MNQGDVDDLNADGYRERELMAGHMRGKALIPRRVDGLARQARSPWVLSEKPGIARSLFWLPR
jgi:hypothetical protein